jgi:hypothetical protein
MRKTTSAGVLDVVAIRSPDEPFHPRTEIRLNGELMFVACGRPRFSLVCGVPGITLSLMGHGFSDGEARQIEEEFNLSSWEAQLELEKQWNRACEGVQFDVVLRLDSGRIWGYAASAWFPISPRHNAAKIAENVPTKARRAEMDRAIQAAQDADLRAAGLPTSTDPGFTPAAVFDALVQGPDENAARVKRELGHEYELYRSYCALIAATLDSE